MQLPTHRVINTATGEAFTMNVADALPEGFVIEGQEPVLPEEDEPSENDIQRMNAKTAVAFIEEQTAEYTADDIPNLQELRLYEADGKNRSTVLAAIDARIAALTPPATE